MREVALFGGEAARVVAVRAGALSETASRAIPTEEELRAALDRSTRKGSSRTFSTQSCFIARETAAGLLEVECGGHECVSPDREIHYVTTLRGGHGRWTAVASSERSGPSTGACGCLAF